MNKKRRDFFPFHHCILSTKGSPKLREEPWGVESESCQRWRMVQGGYLWWCHLVIILWLGRLSLSGFLIWGNETVEIGVWWCYDKRAKFRAYVCFPLMSVPPDHHERTLTCMAVNRPRWRPIGVMDLCSGRALRGSWPNSWKSIITHEMRQ